MPKGRTPATEKPKRIQLAKALLGAGYTLGDTIQLLCTQYKVGERSAFDYISEARQLMLIDLGLTEQELKAQSFIFYSKKSHDARVSAADQIRARMQIDRLMGLVKPVNNFIQQNATIVQQNSEETGPRIQKVALPGGELIPLAEYKRIKVAELTGQFAHMVMDKAKAYGLPLSEELAELDKGVEGVRNVTPIAEKAGKRKRK